MLPEVGDPLLAIVAFWGGSHRIWGVDQKAKSLNLLDFLILFRERLGDNFWEGQVELRVRG